MKRLFMVAIVSLATAFCALGLSAQTRWGITGGFGWSQSNVNEIIENQAPAGWNAGLTISFDLPLGFSLQPTFRYHHKDAMLTNTIGQSMSYVEVPVSLQWGPDLLLFRPFIDATPFVGYALANETYSTIDLPGGLLSGARISKDSLTGWEGKQRVGYGIGLGGGIEIWRFQLVARYNWNLGNLYDVKGWDEIKEHLGNLDVENSNFGGVTLNLSYFF